jgi:thiol-disulfide isomerase/thioredoxin
MINRIISVALLVCMASVGRLDASDPTPESSNFFVAPIKTDVHRALVSEQASAYAVVNGSVLVKDAMVDLAPLNEAQFAGALKKLGDRKPSHLKLLLRYKLGAEGTDAIRTSIRTRLEEICRSAGFQTVSASESFTSAPWHELSSTIGKLDENEDTREQIVEDEFIRAYPLRTRLSKLVVGNADFVVEIKQPFDGRQQDISGPLRASIKRAVQLLDFGPKKGKLQFRVSSTSAGEKWIEKLFSGQRPLTIPPNVTNPAIIDLLKKEAANFKPSQGMELAQELGFDGITFSHSPSGGAPEKLIGLPAPDFSLPTLAGDKLDLRSFIGNRPALVAFWGVACGPCCREAPHLTRMHQKYGSNFAIVAVNAYDESRDVVSKFAEETKLQHTILLNGSKMAELYHVAAYPTTFWINREGTVESYEIEFDSPARLERRIVEMLKSE